MVVLRTDVQELEQEGLVPALAPVAPLDLDREAYELAQSYAPAAPTLPSVDIILVTHESREDLERCFATVERAAELLQARILVVDNASTDGSLEFCLGQSQTAQGISLEENRGYAAAVNVAAGCSSADFLVLLNPDISLESPEAIAELVEHLEQHPGAAVAAPRLLNPDGSVQSSARVVPNLAMVAARQTRLGETAWGKRCAGAYLAPPADDGPFQSVEWVLGAAMCVRRRDFDRVRGWNSRYFLYFEDVDFCVRLRRVGRQVHYLPGVEMVHDHRRLSDRSHGSARVSAVRRHHIRSGLRFFRRNPYFALRGLITGSQLQRLARGTRRVTDILIASIVLALMAPLLALVALAIRRDSEGPVLFRQQRIGRGGVPFTMLKFRTMRVGAERELADELVRRHVAGGEADQREDGRAIYKVWPEDPRITRVGALLRRWSLDELPQFMNVLRGDMTLVGFRPPTPQEVAHYPGWYHGRFVLAPGITGLWQVSGRNQRSYEEMVLLDIEYATRRSLVLDLMLVLRTPAAVLARRGAA